MERLTFPELRCGIPASPEYAEAWRTQQNISHLKRQLKLEEEKFKELCAGLADKEDEVFAVANLRATRTVNNDWIQQNMPDTWSKVCSISDKAVGEILKQYIPMDELITMLYEYDAAQTAAKLRVTVKALEDELGKARVRTLEGTGVTTTWSATSKTAIVIKHPERYPQLTEGDDEEDDE